MIRELGRLFLRLNSMPHSAAAPRTDARIGARLGKYRMTARLGQGGMGIVYAAVDTLLLRTVAIKILPDSLSDDPVALRRFLHEAQAAARLNHPHVVSIYEVDRVDDTQYIVMELIRGGSVQEFLREGRRFGWREATQIAVDVCRGLAAAHAAGLIHRDIKPANVMRSHDGLVKVADFGLAKLVDEQGLSHSLAKVVGTPDYMSPEQCRCDELDGRSDVYAVGATYYAMLTGRPPFPAETPVQVMFAHCSRTAPDPRDLEPTIPESCAAIVRRAMAKERSERFASAAETAAALEAALAAEAAEPDSGEWGKFLKARSQPDEVLDGAQRLFEDPLTKGRHQRRRRWTASITGALLVCVGIAWGWSYQAGRQAEQALDSQIAAEPAPTTRSADHRISPDGTPFKLDSPGTTLAFSADGRWLAVGGAEGDIGLKLWDWKSGELQPERRLRLPQGRPHQHITALAFAPDGAGMAVAAQYEAGHEILMWDLHAALPPHRLDLGETPVAAIAFSAEGLWLAAACNAPPAGTASIRIWDRATWTESTVQPPITLSESPARWLAFSATVLPRLAVGSGRTVTLWGMPSQQSLGILEQAVSTSSGVFASKGDLLAVVGMNYVRLRWTDPGGPSRLIELPSGTAECVAISADGAWCAVGGGTERSGLVTLFDTAGRHKPVQLRGHDRHVRAVAFHPEDGIIASTGDDRTVRLWDVRNVLEAKP